MTTAKIHLSLPREGQEEKPSRAVRLPDDAIVARRPNFRLEGNSLTFLISRQPHANFDAAEQAVWQALSGEVRIGDLRTRSIRSVDGILQRFIDLQVCELLPSGFPADRRRIVVIEPHMDDAALSVGGTMWLCRHECEFTVATIAGISNFTIAWRLDQDYFDIATVSALRKAESALFVRLLGGRHVALDRLEAPLRYRHGRWTLDWFRQHRQFISAFGNHCPGPLEHLEWSSAIADTIASLHPQEIWMPLGIGKHTDHELVRSACLHLLVSNPQLAQQCIIKLYQDVPYAERFPNHTDQIVKALRDAGARLDEEQTDISEVMDQKLRLISIFASQLEMDRFRPRVEKCARQAATPSRVCGELFHRVVVPPATKVEPLSCYVEKDIVHPLAQSLLPWLRRNRSASLIRFFLLTPVGRWAADMEFLLQTFPQARFELHVASGCLAETETFTSSRIVRRPVKDRWPYWVAHAVRTAVSGSGSLVILSGRGREHVAKQLSFWSIGSDSILAETMNHFVLALRLACTTTSGKGAPLSAGATNVIALESPA